MDNCRGCGAVLEPSQEQVNSAVDRVLETSVADAIKYRGVCPLCGHSQAIPLAHRKSVQFLLLVLCIANASGFWVYRHHLQQTARMAVVNDAIDRMSANGQVVNLLGKPIVVQPGTQGQVIQDETGWQEARLTIPIRGTHASGIARVAAGRVGGPWTYSTFEVVIEREHKKVDLISGRVVEFDANAYVQVHTLPAAPPEYVLMDTPPPRIAAGYPCVVGTITGGGGASPGLGKCAIAAEPSGPVDQAEADLRYGRFVLRETDLFVNDVFQVPLTRTYASEEWASTNPVHAFGRNTNHPWDIAPLGTRNPYTWQEIVLADGDFLSFDRVSKGTGYTDAVYRHVETATRFYKAIQRWNGDGWTTQLADGSQILFPESYNAKNLAQGAPTEFRNANGDRLQLIRDPQRNLKEIRTPHGHWIRFTYDNASRITRAESDAGEWAQYSYSEYGMLSSVALSTGHKRNFEYHGFLMTAITDEDGQMLLRNWYKGMELIRQQFRDGEVYSYSYDMSSNGKYSDRAYVTSPEHSPQTIPTADYLPELVKRAQ